MLYRLHTLDILDGEVNDVYRTEDILTLPEKPTKDDVRKALVQLERMADDWPVKNIRLEWDEEDLFVGNKEKKVYLLKPEEDEEEKAAYCECGELMDKDCFGEPRCAVCDPPCPGCADS